MKDYKIGVRLGFLAMLLLLATVLVGLTGWRTLHASFANNTLTMQRMALLEQSVDAARSAQVQFKGQVQEWKNILLRGRDPQAFTNYRQAFIDEGKATQNKLQTLNALLTTLELSTPLLPQAQQAHAQLNAQYLTALQQFKSDQPDSAHVVDGLVKGMDRAPTKQIDDIVGFVLRASEHMRTQLGNEQAEAFARARTILIATMIVTLLLGAALTWCLIRSISLPLKAAVAMAQTVARGDLRLNVMRTSGDEIGALLQALQHMSQNLASIVTEVRLDAENIASASGQIAAGNLDLSTRTEQQAGSLERTVAAMDQITSTVKQNADNTDAANRLATSASEVAAKGGKMVAQVVATMDLIQNSSHKIADIISVIDGIAFQTNILALNAAVEAARAGEQGRGFAVVASEVRSLAQRSAAAAKEIKDLIGDSVAQVNSGSSLVGDTGATMQDVVGAIEQVALIMAEITRANQEQSIGINQVNQAMAQMDQVTQQNTALVEQASAAASSLQQRAAKLMAVVSAFKLT